MRYVEKEKEKEKEDLFVRIHGGVEDAFRNFDGMEGREMKKGWLFLLLGR